MIQELPITFEGKGEVKGFSFSQIKQRDNMYIYKVTSEEEVHYELFERNLVHKFDFETKTQLDDMKVKYPKSGDFGVWAWTFANYQDALDRLHQNTTNNP